MTRELQKLQAKHYRLIELSLEGLSFAQIAEEMGLSAVGVKLIVDSPVFQGELARRRAAREASQDEHELVAQTIRAETASDLLHGATLRAARKQIDLLEAENEGIQQRAAMDILDRAGIPKVTRADSQSVGVQILLDGKVLERLLSATKECFGEVPNFPLDEETLTRAKAV